jgi:hypothetical protein
MQKRIGVLWLGFLGTLLPLAAYSASPSKASEGQTLVIVLKNGKQQSFAMADVARIEFQGPGSTAAAAPGDLPGRGHFLGKWALGTGNGDDFYVTLEANGDASKSIGSVHHGTWTVVNGEAHITWDEGSYDAIRRVGSKWEKFWYPDASFSGKPNNVTGAEHIESKPI